MTVRADGLDGTLLPSPDEIHRRLGLLFPPELDARGWATRRMASRVVFVMLYGYAIEGFATWLRPTAVTDMTDEQAARHDRSERQAWLEHLALAGGFRPAGCAFVTAFQDRNNSPFPRMASSLAWGSFAWFATEPEAIVFLREGREEKATLEAFLRSHP